MFPTEHPPKAGLGFQHLASLAFDIMQLDRGTAHEVDRVVLICWLMLLRYLDDLQRQEESHQPTARLRLEAPYRWRDWAARPDGLTGEPLLAFLERDEARRPDGSIGPGLFAYLRGLPAGDVDGPVALLGALFGRLQNPVRDGHLLRDILNKVNGLPPAEEDLGDLYEALLERMRAAAQYYTPRPLVRFMAEATGPCPGETVLDPACGTGGFLIAALEHMRQRHPGDAAAIRAERLCGTDIVPGVLLIAWLNLLLHGAPTPRLRLGNSLEMLPGPLFETRRADVLLSDFPLGGRKEAGVHASPPWALPTRDLSLLFLQLAVHLLPPPHPGAERGGRAAVIVPNAPLFAGGTADARVRAWLLETCRLHTIVRLPPGVLAPYTDMPVNVLFFDRAGPTQEIWFYEVSPPPGSSRYSRRRPLRDEDLADCLKWWGQRAPSSRAWRVGVEEIATQDFNLDRRSPHPEKAELAQRPPEQLVARLLENETRMRQLLEEIGEMLGEEGA
jgi:type I restriction enzyme M protein